ncbi:MAG: molybdenum cofactor guanylyltransferase [Deltaproteobacteria bacterium]|nr:molybdenum cofactor guanylyltransferase [Deltaproteobacteria bacterium]
MNLNGKSKTMEDITGVILAGGKSLRFGKNKALAEFKGERLIERVVKMIGSVFKKVIIISNTPGDYKYLGIPIYEDMIKGLGPLGGIYTGLGRMNSEAGFFVACDMPFLNTRLIRYLVSVRDNCDAVVPKVDWMFEALHSIYSKRCLPYMKEMIDLKELQIIKVLDKVSVRYVDETELRSFDPELRFFININRESELKEAEMRLEEPKNNPQSFSIV